MSLTRDPLRFLHPFENVQPFPESLALTESSNHFRSIPRWRQTKYTYVSFLLVFLRFESDVGRASFPRESRRFRYRRYTLSFETLISVRSAFRYITSYPRWLGIDSARFSVCVCARALVSVCVYVRASTRVRREYPVLQSARLFPTLQRQSACLRRIYNRTGKFRVSREN